MAKRFIETSFFKDPFVRSLQGACKGFYIYLFLDCSNSGMWDVELDVARLRCGIPESISDEELKTMFSDKIIEVDEGQKWLLKNFINIQHNGELKANNRAHTSAIEELKKYNLLDEIEEDVFSLKETLNKELTSSLEGSSNDPIVKVKVKVEGKGNSKGNSKNFTKKDFRKILIDLGADETYVNDWFMVRDKKKAVYSQTSLKTFINECNKYDFPVSEAVKICAENNWSGFKYQWLQNINQGTNEKQTNNTQGGASSDFREKTARRLNLVQS